VRGEREGPSDFQEGARSPPLLMVARVQLPREAKRGEVIEIRVAIQHPMETGFRFDDSGRIIPKNVINDLVVRYNGVEIFHARMGSGVAANPYLQFYTVAEASGEIEFSWVDDAGVSGSERASINVI
jgi:sulfur-oxidizing protein SoxZ